MLHERVARESHSTQSEADDQHTYRHTQRKTVGTVISSRGRAHAVHGRRALPGPERGGPWRAPMHGSDRHMDITISGEL